MSPCDSGVRTVTTVCQTCGDKGESGLLIYCGQCRNSAVHLYCLDNCSPGDDKSGLICEECAPKVPKVRPSRTSERTNWRTDRAVEVGITWKNKLYKNGSSTARRSNRKDYELFMVAKSTNDCSLPIEKSWLSLDGACGNQELRKRRRRLVLEDGDSSEEKSELAKANVAHSAPPGHNGPVSMAYCQLSLHPDNLVHAQPVIDPIWRGCFSITSGKNVTIGLLAHLSSKACSKVYDATNALPPVLNVEILPRCDVWPKSFQKLPPTDDSIALYFFPESEMDERVFDTLLDDVNECDLALKTLHGDAELLVFSSLALPQMLWRFRRKYYLWGVFRQKQHQLALAPTKSPVAKDAECERPSEPITQAGSKGVKSFSETVTTNPQSPISAISSHPSNKPRSPFLHKAKISSSDSLSSYSSKFTTFSKVEQGRDEAQHEREHR